MSAQSSTPYLGQHDAMLKFVLAARRKRSDTQERYFYEWGNIHVALMVTTPEVMSFFQRYTQHFSVAGVTDDMLPLPLSDMQWDNMADHWVASYPDLLRSLKAADYVTRMQPHKFGDDAFNVALMSGEVVHQDEGFKARREGVKLLLWLKPPPGRSDGFEQAWRATFTDTLLASPAKPLIRKYIRNTPRPVDAAMFAGTLFARGGVNEFAVLDELWFDSLEDLAQLRKDPAIDAVIGPAIKQLGGDPGSFSMVTTERVVYDYVTPGEISPRPATDDPNSLETRIAAQGFKDWNIPKPARRKEKTGA